MREPPKTVIRSNSSFLKDDRLDCFNSPRPADISESDWRLGYEAAQKLGALLPDHVEQAAFTFYYMGETHAQISAKLNIPLGQLLYTSIHFKWSEKIKVVKSTRAGEKVTKADAAAIDLITDAMVATAAIYRNQIAEAIKDPEKAKTCAFIPKNFKELQTLVAMLQTLQTKEVEQARPAANGGGITSVNVNIANLPASHAPSSASHQEKISAIDVTALPPSDEEQKLKYLELLKHVSVKE